MGALRKACLCCAACARPVLRVLCPDVGKLRDSPKDLWLVYGLKVMESYAYFVVSLSFTLYLTDDDEGFNFSATRAGLFYGVWGVLISALGLVIGPFIDRMGVRKSLIVGSAIATAGRLLFAVARSDGVLYLSIFLLQPLGMALGIPVLTIGVKRYTTAANRTVAFGVFYAVMNIAALASGPVTDLFRLLFTHDVSFLGTSISPLRMVFLTSAGVSALQVLVATRLSDVGAESRPSLSRAQVAATFKEPRFRRLMVFSLAIVLVRLIFRALDSALPLYMTREFGEDAPYGSVYSINPFMVILLAPMVAGYTQGMHPYRPIVLGSWISASSVFFLVITAAYWTSISFVVVLSLGEVIYSPKVYEYTLSLAPEGREGAYTTLANAPMFVAKLLAGSMTGLLLDTYCPEDPPRQCELMWLIVGLMSMLSPISLTLFRGYIQPQREVDEWHARAAEAQDAAVREGEPGLLSSSSSSGVELSEVSLSGSESDEES